MFQRIVANLVAANTRKEILEGREYLAVPTVMLTVGVHNGSEGPAFYGPDDLGKTPNAWNHKPIVVNHPMLGGKGISACDPKVVENQKIGLLFNTVFDGRLKTESWLDIEKTDKVDSRILPAIRAGKMIEVSTGLYFDPEKAPGTWNSENYGVIVRNILPDHLAILPDEVGACSVKDGAGLLRNADGSEVSYDDVREQLRSLLMPPKSNGEYPSPYVYIADVFPKYTVYESNSKSWRISYTVKDGKVSLKGDPEQVHKVTTYVTANGRYLVNEDLQVGGVSPVPQFSTADLSDILRRQQMQKSLADLFSTSTNFWSGWVVQVIGSNVIYFKDGKLFRLPYSQQDAKITFGSQPEEIELSPQLQTAIANMESIMSTTPQVPANGDKIAARKVVVNSMISQHGWPEADRTFLETLPDDGFEKVKSRTFKDLVQPLLQTPVPAQNVAAPVQPKPLSTEEYVNAAPPEIRTLLANALATTQAEKKQLVATILANRANPFTEQFLLTKDNNELRGIAMLAGNNNRPVANYSGQADVPMFLENRNLPATNHAQEALVPAAMTFDPIKK